MREYEVRVRVSGAKRRAYFAIHYVSHIHIPHITRHHRIIAPKTQYLRILLLAAKRDSNDA